MSTTWCRGRSARSTPSLRDAVRSYDFPEVFGPLVPTRVRSVPAAGPEAVAGPGGHGHTAVGRQDHRPVADSCARRVEGSGFVYAQDRIITNAHVVAGIDQPSVQVGGDRRQATVVLYDPDRDVAVLYVPDLGLRPLSFASRPVDTNADAILLGYPEDGPFFAGAARIRDRMEIRGPGHLQRPYGDPRGLLDLRRRPLGQLRRTADRAGRHRARRDLRGRGRPAVHRLRADRRRGGPPTRGPGASSTAEVSTGGPCAVSPSPSGPARR